MSCQKSSTSREGLISEIGWRRWVGKERVQQRKDTLFASLIIPERGTLRFEHLQVLQMFPCVALWCLDCNYVHIRARGDYCIGYCDTVSTLLCFCDVVVKTFVHLINVY